MNLKEYDGKRVRVEDIYGYVFTGLARYENCDYLMHEYGGDEDGLIIKENLVYNSQVKSIELITVHGTAELWTQRLTLREYRMEDAETLYRNFGMVPSMYQYSGWNPYATPEMARQTVRGYIQSYGDERFYAWVMDFEDVLIGTIGAYDYEGGQIEVGFSVDEGWRGRGYATEALVKVLEYLTENEGIPRVTAWCAAENTASRGVLEKAGMRLVRTEKAGLTVGDRAYDKLFFEYRRES